MATSISFGSSVSGTGVASQSKSVTVTADEVKNYNVTVPANTTDKEVSLTITLSTVKGYYMSATGAIRVESNSTVGTGTAGDTYDLAANQPLVWYDGCNLGKHFALNVTKLYLTNSTSSEITFSAIVASDATP